MDSNLLNSSFKDLTSNYIANIKPWQQDFFSADSFTTPDVDAIKQRIPKNFSDFYVNYMIIALLIAAVILLFNPMDLIIVSIFVGLNFYVSIMPDPIVIGSNKIDRIHAQIFTVVASGLVTLFFSGVILFAAFGLGVLTVSIHAALHKGTRYGAVNQNADV